MAARSIAFSKRSFNCTLAVSRPFLTMTWAGMSRQYTMVKLAIILPFVPRPPIAPAKLSVPFQAAPFRRSASAMKLSSSP